MSLTTSRRGFLTGTAAGLTSLSIASSPSAEPTRPAPTGAPFRFALNAGTLMGYKLPLAEQIDLAHRAGYAGFEPWMTDVSKAAETGALRDLARRCSDAGLTVINAIGFAAWAVNDDAARAIALYCDLVARAVIDGLSASQIASGVDVGAARKRFDFMRDAAILAPLRALVPSLSRNNLGRVATIEVCKSGIALVGRLWPQPPLGSGHWEAAMSNCAKSSLYLSVLFLTTGCGGSGSSTETNVGGGSAMGGSPNAAGGSATLGGQTSSAGGATTNTTASLGTNAGGAGANAGGTRATGGSISSLGGTITSGGRSTVPSASGGKIGVGGATGGASTVGATTATGGRSSTVGSGGSTSSSGGRSPRHRPRSEARVSRNDIRAPTGRGGGPNPAPSVPSNCGQ